MITLMNKLIAALEQIIRSPDLVLIAFIVTIASAMQMYKQYPLRHNASENTAKMLYGPEKLKAFYTDPLFHVQTTRSGKQYQLTHAEVRSRLKSYYLIDYVFLIGYTYLFFFTARYYRNAMKPPVGLFKRRWFYYLVICLIMVCFVSYAVENSLSMHYIHTHFEDYPVGLQAWNVVKTLCFIALVYLLVIRHMLLLGSKIIALLKKFD